MEYDEFPTGSARMRGQMNGRRLPAVSCGSSICSCSILCGWWALVAGQAPPNCTLIVEVALMVRFSWVVHS